MNSYIRALGLLLTAVSASAGVINIDFGTGAGVFTGWPGSAATASSTAGIVLPNPLLLDTGELKITGTGGAVDCTASTTNPLVCANNGAYGLGVTGGAQDPRIDNGETITLALTAGGYTAKLLRFDITGFNGTELGQYSINGGAQVGFAPGTVPVILGTPTAFTTITWSVPAGNGGNFSLSALSLDITAVPEPATVGLALAGLLCILGRRRR